METVYHSCPVCDHPQIVEKWTVNGFPIAGCALCSAVFVRRKFTQDELTNWYTETDEAYDDDNVQSLSFYYERLKKLILNYRSPGRILDVGCSGGWFLDLMQGWDAYGLEISARDAAVARKKHGDRIFAGHFDAYPVPDEAFDAITMQDVFDHMPNPVEALEKCHSMLAPGGLLAIKVHDISCLYAKLTGPKFYAVIPPYHLFYYNRKSLSRVLHRTGFEVIEHRHIAHLLKVQTIFYRLSRANEKSTWHRIHLALRGTALGNVTIRKNLHDIITVIAKKRG